MIYHIDVGSTHGYLEPEPVFLYEEWLDTAYEKGLCPECHCIDRRFYPQNFEVVLDDVPEGQVSALIENTGITIWRRDFLGILSEYMDGFIFGDVYLSDGTFLEDYATCYSKDYIILRGNIQSRYYRCSTCGTVTSKVKPGPQYVLRRYIKDSLVYQDAYCRMFLTEEIARSLNMDDFENVGLEPILVRDIPPDGLSFEMQFNSDD